MHESSFMIRLRQLARLIHVISQVLAVIDVFLVDYVGPDTLSSDSKG